MAERSRWGAPAIPETLGIGSVGSLARHYKHAVKGATIGDHDTLADIAEDAVDLKNYLKDSMESGALSQAAADARTRIRNTMVKGAAEALGHVSGDKIPEAHYRTRLDSHANSSDGSSLKVKGLLEKIATATAADELIHYAEEAIANAGSKEAKAAATKELAQFKKWKAKSGDKTIKNLIWKQFDLYHGTAALGKDSLSNLVQDLSDPESTRYDGLEVGQVYQLLENTLQKGHQNLPAIFEAQVSAELEKKYDEHEFERAELVGTLGSRVKGYKFEDDKKDVMTSLLSPREIMPLLRQSDLKEKDVRAYGMVPHKDNEIRFPVKTLENTYMDKAA